MKKKAASLVELLTTIVLIALITICGFASYIYVSTFAIKAENYSAATEFLTQTIETVLSYRYDDPALNETTTVPYDDPLPNGCNLKDKYIATRQYTVSAGKQWDTNWSDTTTNNYKYITATINWNDGANRTLTMSIRKRK